MSACYYRPSEIKQQTVVSRLALGRHLTHTDTRTICRPACLLFVALFVAGVVAGGAVSGGREAEGAPFPPQSIHIWLACCLGWLGWLAGCDPGWFHPSATESVLLLPTLDSVVLACLARLPACLHVALLRNLGPSLGGK